jgi:pyridoxamine 5'-phosphate oxidase
MLDPYPPMPHTKDPIELFQKWYQQELQDAQVAIPSACCLSTAGLDGHPNARMVSLKEVADGRFIITCPLNSRKALEIGQNGKVSLTFWWTRTERQVRVQGKAERISDAEADRYFAEREEHIQVLTWASEQGETLESLDELRDRYEQMASKHGRPVPRPGKWGGFAIVPVRIEFMQFRHDRFHERLLFQRREGEWDGRFLQP